MKKRAPERGVDGAEGALPGAALDVAGQELAQPADPLLVEGLRQLVALERRVEEQAEEGRIRARRSRSSARASALKTARSSPPRRQRFDRRVDRVGRRHPRVEDGGVDRLLAVEVAIERRLGDADRGGDVAGGGAVEAARAEALGGRAQDLRAALDAAGAVGANARGGAGAEPGRRAA